MPDITKRKSYKALLSGAKRLIWKFGIKRVSVEEICKEAGVSKMTFYRMFANKKEIVEKVFQKELDKGLVAYKEIMAADISFPKKVEQIIQLKIEESQNMSSEFLRDFYAEKDGAYKSIVEAKDKIYQVDLVNDFKLAQKKGWIRSDYKIETLPYVLSLLQSCLQDPNYLRFYKNVQDAIIGVTNFFFYGIFNEKRSLDEH